MNWLNLLLITALDSSDLVPVECHYHSKGFRLVELLYVEVSDCVSDCAQDSEVDSTGINEVHGARGVWGDHGAGPQQAWQCILDSQVQECQHG